MPLSEHEQRLLDQIERALYAEDPKFASTVRGGRLKRPSRRRRLQGIGLFVLGVVALVVGVVFTIWRPLGIPVVSVVGFLLMLGGAVLAVTSAGASKNAEKSEEGAEGVEGAAPGAGGSAGGSGPAAGRSQDKDKGGFTSRMEERFRRRFEQE